MKKAALGVIASVLVMSGPSFGLESTKGNMDYESLWGSSRPEGHPVLSIGGTEVIMTDRWVDTFLVEMRVFKNLNQGLAVGAKVGSDFHDESEFGIALRKTLVDTLYTYGDLGYSEMDADEGEFAEVGLGTYFWKNNILGINGGFKHYFSPSETAFTVGFTMNLYTPK